MRDRIARCAAGLEVALDQAAVDRLAAWLALLADRNRSIDLTAARSEDELVDLMVADALVLAGVAKEGATVVDVGSGAGGPGLALALIRRDLQVTLVEPLQKRVAFLRAAIGVSLGRGAERMPEVVRGKGEDLAGRRRFDLAMARATMAPPAWVELGAKLAGEVVVLLAREPPPRRAGWVVSADRTYAWPLTGAERRILVYAGGRWNI